MITQSTFEKREFNQDYDHQSSIVKMFNEMGFSKLSIVSCLENGASHYVTLNVEVINEGNLYYQMTTSNGLTSITVRISDHESGLERNCGGVSGNKMTLRAFKKLIHTGAIANNN